MRLDGWLKLSEITADPLLEGRKYQQNLRRFRMRGLTPVEFFSLTFTLFLSLLLISASKYV